MAVRTVAVLSPGDMGSSVGRALREHGLEVITLLNGRSERTRTLAAEAGLADAGSMRALVDRADLVLSILVPSEAEKLAGEVADAIRASRKPVAFADCNAIAPETVKRIGRTIEAAGGRFIDAGIIGGPPRGGNPPRFYASGPHQAVLGELDGKGIRVPLLGGEVGRASALKMCYAAITKGTQALYAATLAAAESLGAYDDLMAEMQSSQPETVKRMSGVVGISSKAFRWVGEMEEIAATFAAAGATSKIHEGAAETFQMIADSPIGDERPETVDRSRSLHETVRLFSSAPARRA
jgi:3-hydroxyisobutyrate dehydrogenase-like beta-hydroxyacid dehydrogenase